MAIQGDGRIVIAGNSFGPDTNYQGHFGVVRLNGSDGSLDTSFGSGGSVTVGLSGNYDTASSVAIQSDGRIVVAGYGQGPVFNYQYQFGVVRLNGSDGSLDTSFGGDGSVTTGIDGARAFASSVAITAGGRIVAGGYTTTNNADGRFMVVRYGTAINTAPSGTANTGAPYSGSEERPSPSGCKRLRS